jgi:hypothetical protein
MNYPTSKFPVLSQSYAGALEENPIQLNGQKVLFDKQVTLLPVELKKGDAYDD